MGCACKAGVRHAPRKAGVGHAEPEPSQVEVCSSPLKLQLLGVRHAEPEQLQLERARQQDAMPSAGTCQPEQPIGNGRFEHASHMPSAGTGAWHAEATAAWATAACTRMRLACRGNGCFYSLKAWSGNGSFASSPSSHAPLEAMRCCARSGGECRGGGGA